MVYVFAVVVDAIVVDFSSMISSSIDTCHCLLGLLLCGSTSVTNGELGGPSKSIMLGSISCTDGDSMSVIVNGSTGRVFC